VLFTACPAAGMCIHTLTSQPAKSLASATGGRCRQVCLLTRAQPASQFDLLGYMLTCLLPHPPPVQVRCVPESPARPGPCHYPQRRPRLQLAGAMVGHRWQRGRHLRGVVDGQGGLRYPVWSDWRAEPACEYSSSALWAPSGSGRWADSAQDKGLLQCGERLQARRGGACGCGICNAWLGAGWHVAVWPCCSALLQCFPATGCCCAQVHHLPLLCSL
jgi:hypothetical protein